MILPLNLDVYSEIMLYLDIIDGVSLLQTSSRLYFSAELLWRIVAGTHLKTGGALRGRLYTTEDIFLVPFSRLRCIVQDASSASANLSTPEPLPRFMKTICLGEWDSLVRVIPTSTLALLCRETTSSTEFICVDLLSGKTVASATADRLPTREHDIRSAPYTNASGIYTQAILDTRAQRLWILKINYTHRQTVTFKLLFYDIPQRFRSVPGSGVCLYQGATSVVLFACDNTDNRALKFALMATSSQEGLQDPLPVWRSCDLAVAADSFVEIVAAFLLQDVLHVVVETEIQDVSVLLLGATSLASHRQRSTPISWTWIEGFQLGPLRFVERGTFQTFGATDDATRCPAHWNTIWSCPDCGLSGVGRGYWCSVWTAPVPIEATSPRITPSIPIRGYDHSCKPRYKLSQSDYYIYPNSFSQHRYQAVGRYRTFTSNEDPDTIQFLHFDPTTKKMQIRAPLLDPKLDSCLLTGKRVMASMDFELGILALTSDGLSAQRLNNMYIVYF